MIVLFIFLTAGYAHSAGVTGGALSASSSGPVELASSSAHVPVQTAADAANPLEEEYKEDEVSDNDTGKAVGEEKAEIADPLEPVNRAMHQFNDKLYFWALKPVAQGYKAVVPEPARISVKNFFSNLGFPARFLSCLLQADFSGAATEAGRFTVNTVWGIGGLLDPSSGKELDLQMQDTDLGQTLGVWGIGQGFYIVWPVLGPSSPRDSVSIAGDYFLYPVSYIDPWYDWLGVRVWQEVNATSLRIGDYESLKNAAVDPYVAFRDAYIQYRLKAVKARKAKMMKSASEEAQSPEREPAVPKKEN
ncbi:MAG: VacJ family lipoprotein [Deltaproteobacteria bacterium]|nr:VacJ family lipoprotein [Deltaproteobacteria bacterium]